MSPARTTRRHQPATAIFHLLVLTLMLAFGLHARLNQYLPEAALHPTPLALYDQDAQSSKILCASLNDGLRQPALLALLSIERPLQLPPRILPARRNRQLGKSVLASLPYYPAPLFFRPPPSLL